MKQPPSGTVTFLFTDIEGSTQLAQRYREEWEALRARHNAILQQAVQAHYGHVFQIIGDAFCVAFGTAVDALRAAVDAQRLLQQEPWSPAPIKVRMGIHTGAARTNGGGEQPGDYKGYTALARAQRLMSAGHGGQVLVSQAAQQLLHDELPDELALRDMGEKRLKDLNRPERVFQVLAPDLPSDFPPLKTLDVFRHNLPAQMTSFIGREKEMADVSDAIRTHRLVTLTGPGGTGKTRLALQVAADQLDQFPDGVWFAGLGVLTEADLVPQTILATFGLREQPGRTALQSVLDCVREKTVLLVLDNCEHLRQACVALVEPLLNDASGVRIIGTSREPLGIEGEAVWLVPSLAVPDPKHVPTVQQLSVYEAAQLFIDRALLVRSDFVVTKDNAGAIAQICFHLDGIPLAIELAAARVRAMTPEQVARRLDDRFSLLTGGKRTGMPHQQTLRHAIDWSYNLLSEPEQDLLQRLSVFAGGWSLEAAEAMATQVDPMQGGWLDLLTSLVDKSLVAHNPAAERYSMLETVQYYAHEKLNAGGRLRACRSTHQRYFIELAEQSDREWNDLSKLQTWAKILTMDLDNLRLALAGLIGAGLADEALRLAGGLRGFWGMYNATFNEGRGWLEQALSLPTPSTEAARARALDALAIVRCAQGEAAAARYLWTECLEINRGLGDPQETCEALLGAAWAAFELGDNTEARTLAGESLALATRIGIRWLQRQSQNVLGEVAHAEGDYVAAEEAYKQSLAIALEDQEDAFAATQESNLGTLAYHRRNWAEARAHYEQAILKRGGIEGWRWAMAMNLSGFANVLYHEQLHVEGAKLQGFVDRLCNEIGARLSRIEQADYVQTQAALKASLGERVFRGAFEEGRQLSEDQAMDLALRKA